MQGTPFGRYRLIALLGRGGMGEVWRAYDTETQRVVAVKVLPANLAHDPVFEQRFRREALAAAGLNDPHVVPIHNFGEIDGRLYVDMRLVNGKDLQAILASEVLDPERAVKIIEQVASALRAAHRIGLVHRDVKPSNILVTEDDFAYLIDFGIARATGQASMTGTGNVIGTWAYMAPERVTTGQTDPRGDTYALGCVLHECLTGSQPFPGNSLEQQIGGHLSLPPPRPSTMRRGVPRELDTVIATAMAKNPDQRYSTVTQMAAAARDAITGTAAIPYPQRRPPPVQQDTRQAFPPTMPQNYRPAQGSGPRPLDPTRQAPPNDRRPNAPYPAMPVVKPPLPAGPPQTTPTPRSKRRTPLVLAGAAAVLTVVGVVVAIVLTNGSSGDNASHPPTSQANRAAPNYGPFTGTYTADFGPKLSLTGKEVSGGEPPGKETWVIRSSCSGDGCVATASRMSGTFIHATSLIFDDVRGRWTGVALSGTKCNDKPVEKWNFIWLQPRPDGSLVGEWISDSLNCYSKRNVTFTRTGDADISALANPADQPARIVTPALSLHGMYHLVTTYTSGPRPPKPQEADYSVETVCLRSGDRCISRFVRTDGSSGTQLLVFADNVWTRNDEYDASCPTGGTSHVKINGTFPLPSPAQDPIGLLTGTGFKDESGSACVGGNYEMKFNRTGG